MLFKCPTLGCHVLKRSSSEPTTVEIMRQTYRERERDGVKNRKIETVEGRDREQRKNQLIDGKIPGRSPV